MPAKPDNWTDIQQRLRQPRPSLSPSRFSEADFERFVQADADAVKEKQVTTSVVPIIEGRIEDAKCIAGGIPLNNLDHLTDGTIVPGNPDIYYGARPEQLDRRVRDTISKHIIPSTQDDLPICPNFFLAAKGPDGSLAVATRQACYDGALGARGMHTLRTYGQADSVLDSRAFTITSIYHGGTLKMYTSHRVDTTAPGQRSAYHMHQLRSFAMADTVETFREGATFYRNARNWAEEQRNEAIKNANEVASALSGGQCGADANSTSISSFESDTSVGRTPQHYLSFEGAEHALSLGVDGTSDTTIDLVSVVTLDEQEPQSDNPKRSSEHLSPAQKKRHRTDDRRDARRSSLDLL